MRVGITIPIYIFRALPYKFKRASKDNKYSTDSFKTGTVIQKILDVFFKIEILAVQRKKELPFGGSLFVIAEKSANTKERLPIRTQVRPPIRASIRAAVKPTVISNKTSKIKKLKKRLKREPNKLTRQKAKKGEATSRNYLKQLKTIQRLHHRLTSIRADYHRGALVAALLRIWEDRLKTI